MPNWCENTLWIFGEREYVNKFLNFPFLDFDYIIPTPFELSNIKDPDAKSIQQITDSNKKKYGYIDSYGWRLNHWGTPHDLNKDDCCHCIAYDDEKYMLVYVLFYTAWFPSTCITRELSRLYPSLYFIHFWDEPGMNLGGYVKFYRRQLLERKDFPSLRNLEIYADRPDGNDFLFNLMKDYFEDTNI